MDVLVCAYIQTTMSEEKCSSTKTKRKANVLTVQGRCHKPKRRKCEKDGRQTMEQEEKFMLDSQDTTLCKENPHVFTATPIQLSNDCIVNHRYRSYGSLKDFQNRQSCARVNTENTILYTMRRNILISWLSKACNR